MALPLVLCFALLLPHRTGPRGADHPTVTHAAEHTIACSLCLEADVAAGRACDAFKLLSHSGGGPTPLVFFQRMPNTVMFETNAKGIAYEIIL